MRHVELRERERTDTDLADGGAAQIVVEGESFGEGIDTLGVGLHDAVVDIREAEVVGVEGLGVE